MTRPSDHNDLGRPVRRFGPRGGRVSDTPRGVAEPEAGTGEGGDSGFDVDELREFLAADRVAAPADPVFKERLRHRLWRMVRLSRGADRRT